jgi:HEPN domain-containing protein
MVDEARLERELARAEQARAAGQIGQARVCARRAAGLAIRAYYRRREGVGWGGDALTQLRRLQRDAAVPEPVRAAAARLTTKVNFDHSLPFTEDPIEDARGIIGFVNGAG